jgi:hypothetical protein
VSHVMSGVGSFGRALVTRVTATTVVFVAVAGATTGCGSSDTSARATKTAGSSMAKQAGPRLVATPVAVKIGETFEVRVRFARALPPSPDGTGAHAEFSIGPSTSDHSPVRMRRSTGPCYRQTLYNDFRHESLRKLHAGSRVTLMINVFGRPPKIARRVTLASDANAVPPGCKLSRSPGPG